MNIFEPAGIGTAADLQQARCPIHDLPLNAFAMCPSMLSLGGCEWTSEQARRIPNAAADVKLQKQQKAVEQPQLVSYYEAERDDYRDKWRRTQGIRGALRNLWRQF